MLQLNAEQVAALEGLKRRRDIARLREALSAAFPEAAGRLGDRYASLIDHGVARGASHGLDHAACLGRYLACWFVLGAAFESRPESAWAAELLAAPGRSQGSKAFQLCRRTREELARLADLAAGSPASEGLTSPAAFDQALAALDRTLMPRGVVGSLLPPAAIALGDACDLDAIDLRMVDAPPGRQPHRYVLEDDQWRRNPAPAAHPPVTLTAGLLDAPQRPPPALPPRLHLLSQPPDREFGRLRLRTRGRNCCDAQVHPLVTLNGPQGLAGWRGAHAADIVLNLYAESPAQPPDDGPRPAIAVETSPQLSVLQTTTCGLRDSGPPLGELSTQLAVYQSEQHWMTWRREPGAPMAWPPSDDPPPPARPAMYRAERDGLALDASRWQAGLEDLDRQLAEGLARLATAWERESGVTQGHVRAEPSLMSGSAGITWGWAHGGGDLSEAPWYRVAGRLDLVACELNLRLDGSLALGGSSSRIILHCGGRETLRAAFSREAGDGDLPAALAPASTRFRQPFALRLEALAQADSSAMAGSVGLATGAVVGACGLRPRPSGPGLQWFCELSIEPVSVGLAIHDPLLGPRATVRPLLPAMALLEWSLG